MDREIKSNPIDNEKIAIYARRFFIGCSKEDDCSDCMIWDVCENIQNKDRTNEFIKFLNSYFGCGNGE